MAEQPPDLQHRSTELPVAFSPRQLRERGEQHQQAGVEQAFAADPAQGE